MVKRTVCRVGVLVAGVMLVFPASAQPVQPHQGQPSGSEVFSEFLACDALAMPADRLICYETTLKAMKSRFGLTEEYNRGTDFAPLLRHRGAATLKPAPVTPSRRASSSLVAEDNPGKRFEATIVSATTDQVGHWIFTLDNGQVWKAADGTWLKHTEYVGKTVIAKRGWMGGWRFKIKEDKEVGRFKRIR